jgi:hypothetical protein
MAVQFTYVPIASQTLAAAAPSVTFSSIPSTYQDLVLVAQARSTYANTSDILGIQINGDTGTNYSYTRLTGDGSSAASARETGLTYWRINYSIPGASATSGIYGMDTFNIMNYANTSTYKTMLWRNSPAQIEAAAGVYLWRSTSAISSIYLFAANASFATGSTFTLYGIAAA